LRRGRVEQDCAGFGCSGNRLGWVTGDGESKRYCFGTNCGIGSSQTGGASVGTHQEGGLPGRQGWRGRGSDYGLMSCPGGAAVETERRQMPTPHCGQRRGSLAVSGPPEVAAGGDTGEQGRTGRASNWRHSASLRARCSWPENRNSGCAGIRAGERAAEAADELLGGDGHDLSLPPSR